MRSAAFLKAERKRRRRLPVSRGQRLTLQSLARKADIETPRVHSLDEASDAITRLETRERQPVLEGFAVSTGGSDE